MLWTNRNGIALNMSANAFLLRFKEKDTPLGVSFETAKAVSERLEVSMTAMIHLALIDYAKRHYGLIFD